VTSPALGASTRTVRARHRPAEASRILLGAAGVLGLITVAEVLPRVGLVNPQYLPPFSEIIPALFERVQTSAFWQALLDTLVTWATGVSIAFVAGVVVGVVIGSIGVLREATASTIEFLRPIPSVALIPLAVIMFGPGRESTVFLIIFSSFWMVIIQVLAGVQDVDPVARDTARSYRFRLWTVGLKVVWPTTLPYAITGFRLAATVALLLTITGELIIGSPGLGSLLSLAQQSGQVAGMYALALVCSLLALVVNLGLRLLERRVLHWHPSVRSEQAL
jgi:ABC-type nitrate/sulfonate/bicarbonate transport system permease component